MAVTQAAGLFLTPRNRVEPDPAQRNTDGFRIRRIDAHRRADDVQRGCGNCRSPLKNHTRYQIETGDIGKRGMGDCRLSLKMIDGKSVILDEASIGLPRHETNGFSYTTEVRAMKNCRRPIKSFSAIIHHA